MACKHYITNTKRHGSTPLVSEERRRRGIDAASLTERATIPFFIVLRIEQSTQYTEQELPSESGTAAAVHTHATIGKRLRPPGASERRTGATLSF